MKEHESAVNELCNTRLENARCNTSSNYQVEEVQTAIKELKLGKSVAQQGLSGKFLFEGVQVLYILLKLCSMHLRKSWMFQVSGMIF